MDVLVLEDDHILGQVFQDALEDEGHTVTVTHDNAEAIALLSNCAFDLLLFDLLIGGETSIPVLDFANYATPDAGVILVTGSSRFSRDEMRLAGGEVSYRLQKPVQISDLVSVVEHFERTRTRPPTRVGLKIA